MDFVHYQPPTEREAKPKEKKPPQKAPRQRSFSGGAKLETRAASISSGRSNASPSAEAEDVEPSTRPRLSPEQVWLLERQFQAHSKPSSEMKRQLAEMTSLTLPRVAVSVAWIRSEGGATRRLIVFPELVPESPRQGEASEETRGDRALPHPRSRRSAKFG